jgi:acetyl-CoA synthetase
MSDDSLQAWIPDARTIAESNIAWLMSVAGVDTYKALHAWSIAERATFWETMVDRIGVTFDKPWIESLDLGDGIEKPVWFVGGRLNIVESCFSAGDDRPAVVFRSESGETRIVSTAELRALVGRASNGLRAAGFRTGNHAAIMMPMNVEAVVAFLAIIACGGVVTTIADSFPPDQIRMRLDISKAEWFFTQDAYQRGGRRLELYSKAVAAGAPPAVVVVSDPDGFVQRNQDRTWDELLSDQTDLSCDTSAPDTMTTILFSSGTTGAPKAIPWDQLAPLRCATDAHLHQDVHPGDVVCWPTNLGWMMGPWLVYASLLNKACMAIYEGAPTSVDFCRFVEKSGVTMLGLVPSLVAAWKNSRSQEDCDWSGIRVFSSTGECSNAADMGWLMAAAGGRPVIEYCGGTEVAGGYITGTVVQPAYASTFSTAALGTEFVILDDEGRETDSGEVYLLPPTVGFSTRLLNADHHAVYYEGTPAGPNGEVLRRHGDHIEKLENGYFRARGRVDDTMNLGGIKISSAQIEEVVRRAAGTNDVAAIAVSPPDGGPSLLVIFAVIEGDGDTDGLKREMQSIIKKDLNPLFKIHDIVLTEALPRTASNKVMRRKLRERYEEIAREK